MSRYYYMSNNGNGDLIIRQIYIMRDLGSVLHPLNIIYLYYCPNLCCVTLSNTIFLLQPWNELKITFNRIRRLFYLRGLNCVSEMCIKLTIVSFEELHVGLLRNIIVYKVSVS